ncbi:MAG: homoserine dehydrogenase [Chitinophagaceae bacterium]
MNQNKLTIGLIGFGVVGEGVYKVLQRTPSLKAYIKKVCVKDSTKKRNAPQELFTTDAYSILNDPEINVVVEVISDTEAAFEFVSTALKNKKNVVSASKKMIAENFNELLKLQKENNVSLLYEASCAASIPVLRNLEEYYDNDLLVSTNGIINGSTNYILTKMLEDKIDFKQALLQAQQLGFAEANPSLDVEGIDAVNKWSIILAHAFGIIQHPKNIVHAGIQNITAFDFKIAEENNQDIKLVANAKTLKNGKIAAFVLPQFVNKTSPLSFVKNEYNGVVIESSFSETQFFYGKGAGSLPTASAVLADISALLYNYAYGYKKIFKQETNVLSKDYYLQVYISSKEEALIPTHFFEHISEAYTNNGFHYLKGSIHLKHFVESNWYKEKGISVIALENPIDEDVEVRKIKKQSIALAKFLL